MDSFLTILIVLAAIAVIASLGVGLVGMVKKDSDPKQQNRMMQLRVLFQFIALALLGLMFALK